MLCAGRIPPAKPEAMQKSWAPESTASVTAVAFSKPIPVTTKSTAALPICASKTVMSPTFRVVKFLSLRQGANSASTANVTRTLISGGSRGDFLCAARRDVAVVGIPADGAFERGAHRTGLESKFFYCAGGVDEHHVSRDFYAFHRNARLSAEQTRECRIGIGYT